ncbi:peptidoglycan DD-metalloendopeptidase family protein [Nocardia sp. NBC_00565]|uniref:M23 family metallopeptidase n=1 Tax=Nocardia sp. NBC_00565 TaxID=2975993 RepID=UPI002E804A77|nr:peptidoglycan DD-metalloendopeptidase family protein [Nocardia sp. NBC_00565]WUC08098.1 peptidoglycan DD-metalloendopeptidase family protein [Nocardia sp. NBC_00565]
MNHRSTFASDNRARSGHRYRSDDEAVGGHSSAAVDPFGTRHSVADHRPAAYGRDEGTWGADSANDSWSQSQSDAQSWAQGDSWSDGGAWASDESWTPESEASWTPEADGSWEGDESWDDSAWEPEDSESPAVPTVIPGRRANRGSGGAHRMPAPPASLKGRAAVAAVAAGAVVAAGQAAFASPEQPSNAVDYEAAGQIHEIAAQSVSVADPGAAPDSPQVLNVAAPTNLGQFGDMLQKGQKFADDLAAQEDAKLRPLFTKFAAGNFTSGFGARWGVQHLGVDIAGPIGTPIYAVADATVIEAGPASGFGMWVRLLHDDGTVTIYGHIDTATVSQGQRVLAGDQIATIGNRGFSTGPHCHFEVWLHGVDKVDPLPWLATRGISLGQQRD